MVFRFHVVLIAAGVLLALGLCAREAFQEAPQPGMAVVYGALAAGLLVYLVWFWRKRLWKGGPRVRIEEEERERWR